MAAVHGDHWEVYKTQKASSKVAAIAPCGSTGA
jgi:hypothetical protein